MDCQLGFLWFGVKAGTAVTLHDSLYADRSTKFQCVIEFGYSKLEESSKAHDSEEVE